MSLSSVVQVSDNPGSRRYEAHVDGRLAGFAQYKLVGDEISFTHTEVKPEYEGKGVAGTLARFALDDARARALSVRPFCSFFRSWIERHPDYADLVVPAP